MINSITRHDIIKKKKTKNMIKCCKCCNKILFKYIIIILFTSCLFISTICIISLSWTYSEVLLPRDYIGNLVIGVIVAKESSYIEEWLSHHFYYGVDKIIIFDNNNINDIYEKQEMRRICSLFENCEITDFNQYDGVGCLLTSQYLCSKWFLPSADGQTSHSLYSPTRRQGMAMKELYYYNNNYKKYRWIMMFDVDEFIVTKDVQTQIPDILNLLPDDIHALHIPRYTFGTNNHTKRPPGAVRLNYCWRERGIKNSKGMARPNQIWMPGMYSCCFVLTLSIHINDDQFFDDRTNT